METSRPSSEQLVDLHVYVVPSDLWQDRLHSSNHNIISETISAGFIRVHPEFQLTNLRQEIEKQLGYDLVPPDFVFCKNVGRSLAQVRERQEFQLKAKHFLPPQSVSPEIFVLDGEVARQYSQTTTHGSNSRTSYHDRVRLDSEDREVDRLRRMQLEDDLRQRLLQEEQERKRRSEELERIERQRIKEQEESHQQNIRELQKLNELRQKQNEEEEQLRIQKIQKQKAEEQLRREMEEAHAAETQRRFQNNFNDDNLRKREMEQEEFRQRRIEMESRRIELEKLSNEISKRRMEILDMEEEHARRLAKWQKEEEERAKIEEERRKEFERLERERQEFEEQQLKKQRAALLELELQLHEKKQEIEKEENVIKKERMEWEQRQTEKRMELEQLKNSYEKEKLEAENNDESNENIQRLKKELELIELQRKSMEEQAIIDRKQAQEEFEAALQQYEEYRTKANQERELREKERKERREEEERLREESERMKNEHEMKMENERLKLLEEKKKFEEEQERWRKEKEDFEEEERRKLAEDEEAAMRATSEREQLTSMIVDESLNLEGVDIKEQKTEMIEMLKNLQDQRLAAEKRREDLIRRTRQLQMKTSNKRAQARDIWKKKYFEEKKRTSPLEDQVTRLRMELAALQRKIISQMETSLRSQRGGGGAGGGYFISPSFDPPSEEANFRIQAIRLQHEIEDLQRRVDDGKMKLSSEIKMRSQAESDLRALRAQATQKKINLTLIRSQQLASMQPPEPHNHNNSTTPRQMPMTQRS